MGFKLLSFWIVTVNDDGDVASFSVLECIKYQIDQHLLDSFLVEVHDLRHAISNVNREVKQLVVKLMQQHVLNVIHHFPDVELFHPQVEGVGFKQRVVHNVVNFVHQH